jgi:hypothetical protein
VTATILDELRRVRQDIAPMVCGAPLAEGLDDATLRELIEAGATAAAVAAAFKVRRVDVDRRIHFLGIAAPKSRQHLWEPLPEMRLNRLWPMVSRMKPYRAAPPGRPARPVEHLRRALPVELERVERELAVAVAEREEIRALIADPQRWLNQGLACWPTIAAALEEHRGSVAELRERLGGLPALKGLEDVIERHLRTLEEHVRDLTRPDGQQITMTVESLERDRLYLLALRESIETGSARSWIALDVGASLGYALRGPDPGDCTDAELRLIARTWGWAGEDVDGPTVAIEVIKDDPTLADLDLDELLRAGADLEDDDAPDDLDPELLLAVDQARGVGSWAPLPAARPDPRTTESQHKRDTTAKNLIFARDVRHSAAWPLNYSARTIAEADDLDDLEAG